MPARSSPSRSPSSNGWRKPIPQPALLPQDPLRRARVRAFALAIACDIHPVQNLKVLARLRELGLPEEQVTGWAAWANREGLAACEALIAGEPGPFCFGTAPTMADLCLVPQLFNARRFGVDVAAFPRLLQGRSGGASDQGVRGRRTGQASPMPSKSTAITMDAVYTTPGYLFRRMQQIAVAIFVEECKAYDLTPVQYAVAGRDPHPSRHRCHAAFRRDRLRPLDARQRDRAAGGQGLYRAQAVARGQADKTALSDQVRRRAAARHHARRSSAPRRGCCSR